MLREPLVQFRQGNIQCSSRVNHPVMPEVSNSKSFSSLPAFGACWSHSLDITQAGGTGLAGSQWTDIWSIMLSHYPASSVLVQPVESKCSQFARKMGAGIRLQVTLNKMDIIKAHLTISQCICSEAYDWLVWFSVSSVEADRSNLHGKWLMRLVLPRKHRWGPVHTFTTGVITMTVRNTGPEVDDH